MTNEKTLTLFEEFFKAETDYDRTSRTIKVLKKPSPELQSLWDYIRGKYVGLSKAIDLLDLNEEYSEYYVKRVMLERSY